MARVDLDNTGHVEGDEFVAALVDWGMVGGGGYADPGAVCERAAGSHVSCLPFARVPQSPPATATGR